jgi:hypothetical protein
MEERSVVSCQLSVNREDLRRRRIAYFRAGIFFLLTAFCLLLTVSAQPETQSFVTAPPPLKIISKAEKSQLESVTDIKERTKLALELMEARLVKAESLSASEQYPEMFTELGSFHALVDNAINFLNDKNNNSDKILNNFKRIEISLRKYITRLELIRRNLPIKYELYVRKLVKHIREARTNAVEPLFDDTVVPEKRKG